MRGTQVPSKTAVPSFARPALVLLVAGVARIRLSYLEGFELVIGTRSGKDFGLHL